MDISSQAVLPQEPCPIYIIGAGGIVNDAHMPAYRMARFPVAGITNRTRERAEAIASKFDIPKVYDSVEEMVAAAPDTAVYDLTLMPAQFVATLEKLPDGAVVLIQKPMGDGFDEALEILEVCQRKKLVAAINCQLRFSPNMIAARNMIEYGLLGEIYSMEVRVAVNTPWSLFPNVMHLPRLEISQHSVHYVDLLRSFLGNPDSILAKTLGHPAKETSQTRSTLIFDYGDTTQAVIHTNHDHEFGPRYEDSYTKFEGTKGAIRTTMGVLKNYPTGEPDLFEYCLREDGADPEWKTLPLSGSWFPEAFIGSMASIQRFACGETDVLPTSVEDVANTMAVVEAAYASSQQGGVPPDYV
ncbi:MAG: Gfo/Idh/MocA family oxidoreductase [Verrucomicrobiota bacterium]